MRIKLTDFSVVKFWMSRFDEWMPVLAIEDECIRRSRGFRCLLWILSFLGIWNEGETPGLKCGLHLDGHLVGVLGHRYFCSDKFAWLGSALEGEDEERITYLRRDTRMLIPLLPRRSLMFIGMSTSETWSRCMRQTSCAHTRSSDCFCAAVSLAEDPNAGIAAYRQGFWNRFK